MLTPCCTKFAVFGVHEAPRRGIQTPAFFFPQQPLVCLEADAPRLALGEAWISALCNL